MRRLCALGLLISLTTGCATAARTHSLAELPRHLRVGQTVRIIDRQGERTVGELAEISPASIAIVAGGIRRDIETTRINRITRRERRIGRGALVGALAGAATWTALIAAMRVPAIESAQSSVVRTPPLMVKPLAFGAIDLLGLTALGALGGIAEGSIKRWRTVYEATDGSHRETDVPRTSALDPNRPQSPDTVETSRAIIVDRVGVVRTSELTTPPTIQR